MHKLFLAIAILVLPGLSSKPSLALVGGIDSPFDAAVSLIVPRTEGHGVIIC